MSYLSFPRIHIAGLFYTIPSNLNNQVENYNPAKGAPNPNTGLYVYPDGTAKFWFEGCRVTSVVGLDGKRCDDPKQDALVGATVQTPSPLTPKRDENGDLRAFAKIADLDPSMQFRSELYGLWIYVEIEGGGGFYGYLEVPQLRDLWFGRTNGGVDGNQVAVGIWHQRLTKIVFQDPASPSPVYDALKAQAAYGLDVKLTVDLFQTRGARMSNPGNEFGYGRMVMTIGPAGADDPMQIVPGHCLYSTMLTPPELDKCITAASTREAGEEAAKEKKSYACNRTDARVVDLGHKSYVLIDLGGTFPLKEELVDGRCGYFDIDEDVVVNFSRMARGGYKSLSNGKLNLKQYTTLGDDLAALKNCVWPVDAGVIQIELTSAEREVLSPGFLHIRWGIGPVLGENPDGSYVNADIASRRMSPNDEVTIDIYVYKCGEPQNAFPEGFDWFKYVVEYYYTSPTQNFAKTKNCPTQDFSFDEPTLGEKPGCFRLTVRTGNQVELPSIRKPMDSQLYLLAGFADGRFVGEYNQVGPPPPPLITLLFWQDWMVKANPTWEDDIGPILKNYVRLYPGMASILNIGDEETVKANAQNLIDHFNYAKDDPSYMPVVRDMSPKTVEMICNWLKGTLKGGGGAS